MRNPILNITKSDFTKITQGMLTSSQIDTIFVKAASKKPAVFLYKTNKTQSEKIRKVLRDADVGTFNGLLTNKRLVLGHKFSPIKIYDSNYNMLNEIAADASDFADIHGMTYHDAYTYYIDKGIKFMGKSYGLSKFKYYKEKIYQSYENELIIFGDNDTATTEAIYKTFCRVYNIKPNNAYWVKWRVDFIKIKQRAEEANLRPSKYLECQIDFYNSINKIPEPSYFHTHEALERTFKLKR